MTTKEIYKRANSISGLEGMTGNERLSESGLMELFDKTKKKDKHTARTILQALKFDELSIGRIVGFSTDSLKHHNPWDFPNINTNGEVGESRGTLEYSNLKEIAMGAPLGGTCKLSSNNLQNTLVGKWCGGPAIWSRNGQKVAIPIWERSFLRGTFQRIGIVDLQKQTLTKYKKKFNVLDLRSFRGKTIIGFESPIRKMKPVEFDYENGRKISVVELK